MLKLNKASSSKLKGVHPDLIKVVNEYLRIGSTPISIIEGVRSLAKQKENVANGRSQTLRSRHLTGHALDIAPMVGSKVVWDWPLYYKLAAQFKEAARNVNIPIEWGGDWRTFKDGPHWQLPWEKYPPVKMPAMAAMSPEMNPITERVAFIRKAWLWITGGLSGGAVGLSDYSGAGSVLSSTADTVSAQQHELTSGDIFRVALSAFIVLSTMVGLYLSYKDYKGRSEDAYTQESAVGE